MKQNNRTVAVIYNNDESKQFGHMVDLSRGEVQVDDNGIQFFDADTGDLVKIFYDMPTIKSVRISESRVLYDSNQMRDGIVSTAPLDGRIKPRDEGTDIA